MKKIHIRKKIWKKLNSVKTQNRLKNLDKTIDFLLEQYESKINDIEDMIEENENENDCNPPTPNDPDFEKNFGRFIDDLIEREKKSNWTRSPLEIINGRKNF